MCGTAVTANTHQDCPVAGEWVPLNAVIHAAHGLATLLNCCACVADREPGPRHDGRCRVLPDSAPEFKAFLATQLWWLADAA